MEELATKLKLKSSKASRLTPASIKKSVLEKHLSENLELQAYWKKEMERVKSNQKKDLKYFVQMAFKEEVSKTDPSKAGGKTPPASASSSHSKMKRSSSKDTLSDAAGDSGEKDSSR